MKTSLIKLEPWSVNIVWGIPNLKTTYSTKTLSIVMVCCCFIGVASVYLEKLVLKR
jgi:hypothetical protein